ncbi:MAG: hypothetical protein NTX50_32375 [Candidatus Sumerlaeota bacterium]|nr:hypothetical protein [Candidatus Sumerlaeota bacterium]
MSNQATKIKDKEIKNLKSDLERMRDDLGKLLSRVTEASTEEVAELRDRAQGELDDLRSQADQTYQKIREESGAVREQVEESIEKHPLTSLLVAFGAGAVIGAIAGRR